MKTDALDIDADGMPVFRPDPAAAPSCIDVTTALGLEQETLHLQDLEASLMEAWASPEDEEAVADLRASQVLANFANAGRVGKEFGPGRHRHDDEREPLAPAGGDGESEGGFRALHLGQ